METVRRHERREYGPAWPLVLVLWLVSVAFSSPRAQTPATGTPTFRVSRDVVSIDVIVRDRAGAVVKGLTIDEFEVREDGRVQELLTSSYQEADVNAPPAPETPVLQRLGRPPVSRNIVDALPPELSGRRMLLLLFDLSAMEPEDVERGVRAAMTFVDRQMTSADVVAIATLTWELRILTDFTGNREDVSQVLQRLVAVDASLDVTSAGDTTVDGATGTPGGPMAVAATDARLRAVRLLADALAPIAQKKALLYFTAGLGNAAQDTPAELRAATSAASRANLAIYPVDTRGLQAVIPSGPARVESRGGEGLFSGRDVDGQFTDLAASQDTMASMASSTGGRLFSGSNDVTAALLRAQQDTAAYYLLGYSSANDARDGRFRRVQVRVRRPGLRVEARAGYYGDRDFARMTRADREAQLEESLASPFPADPNVHIETSWIQAGQGGFRVPFAIAAPWLMTSTGEGATDVDVLAVVEDEQGRAVARLRDTVKTRSDRAGGPVVYVSSVDLPAGRFTLKAIVRDGRDGRMGSTRTEISLPALARETLAVSPVWQRDVTDAGVALRVEVVDGLSRDQRRPLTVTLSVFKDSTSVMEITLVPMDVMRGPGGVSSFSTVLQSGALPAGSYVSQATVVDPLTGRFATSRAPLVID